MGGDLWPGAAAAGGGQLRAGGALLGCLAGGRGRLAAASWGRRRTCRGAASGGAGCGEARGGEGPRCWGAGGGLWWRAGLCLLGGGLLVAGRPWPARPRLLVRAELRRPRRGRGRRRTDVLCPVRWRSLAAENLCRGVAASGAGEPLLVWSPWWCDGRRRRGTSAGEAALSGAGGCHGPAGGATARRRRGEGAG